MALLTVWFHDGVFLLAEESAVEFVEVDATRGPGHRTTLSAGRASFVWHLLHHSWFGTSPGDARTVLSRVREGRGGKLDEPAFRNILTHMATAEAKDLSAPKRAGGRHAQMSGPIDLRPRVQLNWPLYHLKDTPIAHGLLPVPVDLPAPSVERADLYDQLLLHPVVGGDRQCGTVGDRRLAWLLDAAGTWRTCVAGDTLIERGRGELGLRLLMSPTHVTVVDDQERAVLVPDMVVCGELEVLDLNHQHEFRNVVARDVDYLFVPKESVKALGRLFPELYTGLLRTVILKMKNERVAGLGVTGDEAR